jgi:UDP-glucose 4-epimerase
VPPGPRPLASQSTLVAIAATVASAAVRVLVTGGAGFIGSSVCRRLTSMPDIDHVVVLDDLSTGSADNLREVDGAIERHVGSILDAAALGAAAEGAAAIVHLAARPSVTRSVADPVATHLANATGTVAVLEAARVAGAHVVVASSSSVYGATSTLPKREDLPTRPMSPYAASKLATEAYTNAYAHSFGMATLALRFFNVFGPRQAAGHAYAAVVPTFIDAALAGRPIPIDGDGRQTRDFTYVDSVAAVVADAVVRRVADPDPVNLAFGTRTDLLALVDLLEGMLGRPLERQHRPARIGDVRDSQADSARLRALFPDIAPVPLDDGLAATVEWMQSLTGA